MATVSKGTTTSGAGNQTNPAFGATMMQARTVFGDIPLNFAQNLKLLLLVAQGEVGKDGETGKVSTDSVGNDSFGNYLGFFTACAFCFASNSSDGGCSKSCFFLWSVVHRVFCSLKSCCVLPWSCGIVYARCSTIIASRMLST